jgi:hypothetical protein
MSSHYAFIQNAKYDEKKNLILYGLSNYMQSFGVFDGTCNQISPYILNQPCGCGTAGGNPYNEKKLPIDTEKPLFNPKTIEQFKTLKSFNITHLINFIIVFLVVMLLYEMC